MVLVLDGSGPVALLGPEVGVPAGREAVEATAAVAHGPFWDLPWVFWAIAPLVELFTLGTAEKTLSLECEPHLVGNPGVVPGSSLVVVVVVT